MDVSEEVKQNLLYLYEYQWEKVKQAQKDYYQLDGKAVYNTENGKLQGIELALKLLNLK